MNNTKRQRIFLCVVDDSSELENALHYAARRAEATNGKVALFYCIEPQKFMHWGSMSKVMEEDANEDAQQHIQNATDYIEKITKNKNLTLTYIFEGDRIEKLNDLLHDPNENISTLVLAAGSSERRGPGPLMKYFVSQYAYKAPVPITVVPPRLSKEEIDELTSY